MALLDRHAPSRARYEALRQASADPFGIRFDEVISPTEGVVEGRRTILLGTNNYLGLTFDPECVEDSVRAVRERGTGTTGSRIANGSYFQQWVCEGGEVELDYQAVAFNMAFDEGPAVLSGFIQECQAEFCGTGTNLPLQVIEIAD